MTSQPLYLASVSDNDDLNQPVKIKTEITDEPEHIIFEINQNIKNEPDAHLESSSHDHENNENQSYFEVSIEQSPDTSDLEQPLTTIPQNIEEPMIEVQSDDNYGQEKNITDLEQILTNITQNIEKEQEDAQEREKNRIKAIEQEQIRIKEEPIEIIIKREPESPKAISMNVEQPVKQIKVIEDEDSKLKIEHNIEVSIKIEPTSENLKQEPLDKVISTIKEELDQRHEAMETESILRNINAVYADDIDNDDGLIDPEPEETVEMEHIYIKNTESLAQNQPPTTEPVCIVIDSESDEIPAPPPVAEKKRRTKVCPKKKNEISATPTVAEKKKRQTKVCPKKKIDDGIPKVKKKRVMKTSRKIADEVMCKCDVCHKLLRSSKSLKRHMAYHTGERPFVCQYCEQDFVTKYALERHIRIHTVGKEYICYVCRTKFDDKDSLDKHKLVHADEWPYPCSKCDKKYKIKGQMMFHYRKVHEGKRSPADEPRDCPVCGKTIYTGKSFTGHMEKHKGIAPTCNRCGKQFTKKAALLVHMRTHTGEAPFACSVCDRKLKTKSHLKMHLRTHLGEKKHECDICGKRFIEKFHLNGHRLTHRGKMFECKPCEKKFTWKESYTNHQRIHHPDRFMEFVCHHCDKRFKLKSYLRQHIVNVCYPNLVNNRKPRRKAKVVSSDESGQDSD